MFSIQDIERMSTNELNALVSELKIELEKRSKARRNELIQAVCDAMNNLYQEFPNIELSICYTCPECGIEGEIDIMDVLCSGREMKSGDFGIY
jgi:CRISPR/Cas system-associated protein Cas5 (RAMP superfamily)